MSYTEICDILDELLDMGVLEVTFTGGEVSVRSDFLEICAYASLLGFVVHIYTNGIGFTDDEITQLCQMNVADIAFSVYSMNPLVHDAITQVPGSFNRTMRTMFAVRSSGIKVIMKTVVMKKNNDGFKDVVDFAKIMHIPLETSMQILATSPQDHRPKQHRLDDEERYFENMLYEAKAFGYGISNNIYCGEKRTNVCGLGQCLNITPNGIVYPCNVLNVSVGNLREQSVRDIWGSSVLQDLRSFGVCNLSLQCQNCESLSYCLYCPGASMRETGNMSFPIPDTCLITNAKRRVYESI
jgi:radical SAM protein with 4Fe4S-binding SPASM domain